jgi:hypothetical protein
MVQVIYALCAVTALLCAWLLLSNYRNKGSRLLLWSGLCFASLFVNNVLLVLDRIVFPTSPDLSTWRLVAALLAVLPLLYGLIWDGD